MSKEFTFPDVLYKGFKRLEYAEAFEAGRVRFSTLRYYREIKDRARADRSEGIGEVKRDADPLSAVITPASQVERLRLEAADQDCFICCFSLVGADNVNALPRHFGDFYLRVGSPERLFKDIQAAICRDFGPDAPDLEAGAVRYNKGHYVGYLTDKEEIRKLPWLQKPADYAGENEYRLHFHCREGQLRGRHNYMLDLGKSLDYCDILKRN